LRGGCLLTHGTFLAGWLQAAALPFFEIILHPATQKALEDLSLSKAFSFRDIFSALDTATHRWAV
jgi:hypothetical protein